jgi:tetratricopeptide (TPR) repeat protein
VTADTVAALGGVTVVEAAVHLERLAAGHILTAGRAGRYTLHDLMRDYAAQLAHTIDGPEACDGAADRLLDWYISVTGHAAALLYPWTLRLAPSSAAADEAVPFDDEAAAAAWIEAEHANLQGAVRHALAGDPPRRAWVLSDALRGYIWQFHAAASWRVIVDEVLDATLRCGDLQAQVAMHLLRATVHGQLRNPKEARQSLTTARRLAERSGWTDGQATVLNGEGLVLLVSGQTGPAERCFTSALRLYEKSGWQPGRRTQLISLTELYLAAGRLSLAEECIERALITLQPPAAPSSEMNSRAFLGRVQLARGNLHSAEDTLSRCLDFGREAGDKTLIMLAGMGLAAVYRETGRLSEALELADVVAAGSEHLTPWHRSLLPNLIGSLHLSSGATDTAFSYFSNALHRSRENDLPYPQAEALIGLGEIHRQMLDMPSAVEAAGEALRIAQRCDYSILRGRAFTVRALAHLDAGDVEAAVADAHQAHECLLGCGDRIGHERALEVLVRAQGL